MAFPTSASLGTARQTGRQGVQTETLQDPPVGRARDQLHAEQ